MDFTSSLSTSFKRWNPPRPVPSRKGCVGGGTGMNCHEFKGGIGTSSRALAEELGGWTVGVLVQANYGWRSHLHIDGVPVGREISVNGGSISPACNRARTDRSSSSSPPTLRYCRINANGWHNARTIGLARAGGNGDNGSGDLFLAFSTGNHGVDPKAYTQQPPFACFQTTPSAFCSKPLPMPRTRQSPTRFAWRRQ